MTRTPSEMRPVEIIPAFIKHAEGSALISFGETKVICTASVQEDVPPFLKESGKGWITAEYAMLPRATHTRSHRERSKIGGRTSEIQRLIGRSLRAVVDMQQLGPRTIAIDCDVLQADGGTRTAAITGGYIALYMALKHLKDTHVLANIPLIDSVAAVSVGIVGDTIHLDLDYAKDSTAEVDMNVVMTGKGNIVEIQGTAEGKPFSKNQMDALFEMAASGIRELTRIQQSVMDAL